LQSVFSSTMSFMAYQTDIITVNWYCRKIWRIFRASFPRQGDEPEQSVRSSSRQPETANSEDHH